MAKNTQPVLKRCRTLGVSPAAMGYSKQSNRNPGGKRRTKKSEYGTQLTRSRRSNSCTAFSKSSSTPSTRRPRA